MALILTGGVLGAEPGPKAAIVYFSVPESSGVDAVAGASRIVERGKVVGNTEWMASVIAGQLKIPVFRITTQQTYPGVHETLVNQAAEELKNKARPRLTRLPDLSPYNVVYIGYPIWWADLPMPLYTFFESTPLAGKTVVLFSTHGGSAWAGTPDTISRLEPGANILPKGLSISRTTVAQSRGTILAWLRELGCPGASQ